MQAKGFITTQKAKQKHSPCGGNPRREDLTYHRLTQSLDPEGENNPQGEDSTRCTLPKRESKVSSAGDPECLRGTGQKGELQAEAKGKGDL